MAVQGHESKRLLREADVQRTVTFLYLCVRDATYGAVTFDIFSNFKFRFPEKSPKNRILLVGFAGIVHVSDKHTPQWGPGYMPRLNDLTQETLARDQLSNITVRLARAATWVDRDNH